MCVSFPPVQNVPVLVYSPYTWHSIAIIIRKKYILYALFGNSSLFFLLNIKLCLLHFYCNDILTTRPMQCYILARHSNDTHDAPTYRAESSVQIWNKWQTIKKTYIFSLFCSTPFFSATTTTTTKIVEKNGRKNTEYYMPLNYKSAQMCWQASQRFVCCCTRASLHAWFAAKFRAQCICPFAYKVWLQCLQSAKCVRLLLLARLLQLWVL